MMKEHSGKWFRIWYMLCFLAFGIIDQRRGSAPGNVQMAAANAVGLVAAAMLLPTLDRVKLKKKIYIAWTAIAALGGAIAWWGWNHWPYREQWVTAVLDVIVWGYLVIYALREKGKRLRYGIRSPLFLCIEGMFALMLFSVHEGKMPLLYMLVLGGFFCIGIPKEAHEDFIQGLLNGIILWFFIQQIIAFGFRPYDHTRYRGLYSGETQNGVFYMTVYCAFLMKWLWLKETGRNKVISWLCFLLAAGCVSFTLYTGGRAPVFGIILVTAIVYIWYDIVYRKSISKLLGHGIMFVACIMVTFPLVYGCIRYLPTILHHPIWFEGEYSEVASVRSFDPWDSERYVSFEEAMEMSVGRMLSAIGIDWRSWKDGSTSGILGLKVHAQEVENPGKPGDTPENPYVISGVNLDGAIGPRIVIHTYYITHLNLWGHDSEKPGFYMGKGDRSYYMDHAHNMFLQIAYDYGIFAGILFLGIYIYSLFCAFRMPRREAMLCVTFLLAILGFGMFEMVVVSGQITVILMGIMFWFVEDTRRAICSEDKRIPNDLSIDKKQF